MFETRCSKKRLAAITAVAALGLAGCDISPRYPVLEGNGGHSSLTPTNEAVATAAEAAAPHSPGDAPADQPRRTPIDQPGTPAQPQDLPQAAVSAQVASSTEVRRTDDDE